MSDAQAAEKACREAGWVRSPELLDYSSPALDAFRVLNQDACAAFEDDLTDNDALGFFNTVEHEFAEADSWEDLACDWGLSYAALARETNVEFVTKLMEGYCPTGALVQSFVIEALANYSERVIKAGPEAMDSPMISGEAWVNTAEHVRAIMSTKYGGG